LDGQLASEGEGEDEESGDEPVEDEDYEVDEGAETELAFDEQSASEGEGEDEESGDEPAEDEDIDEDIDEDENIDEEMDEDEDIDVDMAAEAQLRQSSYEAAMPREDYASHLARQLVQFQGCSPAEH